MNDLNKATEAASLAVKFDRIKDISKAIQCYRTAARSLDTYLHNYYHLVPPDRKDDYSKNIREYLERANFLERQSVEENKNLIQQCKSLLAQGLDADEKGLKDTALEFYTQAVDLAIDITKKNGDTKTNDSISDIAKVALGRAEILKGISEPAPSSSITRKPVPIPSTRASLEGNTKVHPTGRDAYTEEEKAVLRHTSNINSNCFLPYMDKDLNEKFVYKNRYEDSDQRLKLSAKQIKEFDRWVRLDEICSVPKMISGPSIDCFSIKQTIISDCSFVASLAVSALYERRFKKKIITAIMYPRDKFNDPVYNPSGKYIVKLHINGVRRKVIIDDLLPYSKYGELLCSFSSNKNEFWVSLLEKAYMKVMGGYDFPGSNSNIDLHALTGWIPERCPISDPEIDSQMFFEKLLVNLEQGNVLATVATGALTDDEADRTGLVATHAYAVLDVRNVNGVKLLKLKNPWSHLRWRGNYSELDAVHWTLDLRRLLDYDPDSAAQFDNGVFWIDYKSILKYFEVFYLNWNPGLFMKTYCIHQKWDANVGPTKDVFNISENPQFSLHVQGRGDVWLLLTRHITRIDDFRDNKEFITLVVYTKNGERVYYPHDPPPHIDGKRINSPHYLCKVPASETTRYTVVVSQYQKTTTIYYTLRAYGKCNFTLDKIAPYPITKQVIGEWSGLTAGGCLNHPETYKNNPKYLVEVKQACNLLLELKGPKEYPLGINVTVKSLEDPTVTAPFVVKSSGDFRAGFVVLEVGRVPAGHYIVTVSTYKPGMEGAFFLEVKATANINCYSL